MYRLWTILGTKNGHEKEPLFFEFEKKEIKPLDIEELQEEKNTSKHIPDYQIQRLSQIAERIENFDAEEFIENAETAYEMIIEAFAKNDNDTLKNLLSENVYQAFSKALEERIQKGLSYETKILEFIATDIEEGQIYTNSNNEEIAQITLLFKTKQVAVIYDKDNNIIENPAKISIIQKDEWTFEKVCCHTNPTWLLTKTKTL